GVVLAMVLVRGSALPIALLAALATGQVFGLVNGLLVVFLGIPPFVATLGMMGVARGIALAVTGGQSVVGFGGGLPGVSADTGGGAGASGGVREQLGRSAVFRRGRRVRVPAVSLGAVLHTLWHVCVRHWWQSRIADPGGRQRHHLPRGDLRAGRSDGRLCRAAADRTDERRAPDRVDWHGIRCRRRRRRRGRGVG